MQGLLRRVLRQCVVSASLLLSVDAAAGERLLRVMSYNIHGMVLVKNDHGRYAKIGKVLEARRRAGTAPEIIAVQEAFTAPSAVVLADLQQRLAAAQRVIEGLPPRCREVFWLCKVEGHSQPRIAATLGISLNMVERHLMRALLDLRAARELLAP